MELEITTNLKYTMFSLGTNDEVLPKIMKPKDKLKNTIK